MKYLCVVLGLMMMSSACGTQAGPGGSGGASGGGETAGDSIGDPGGEPGAASGGEPGAASGGDQAPTDDALGALPGLGRGRDAVDADGDAVSDQLRGALGRGAARLAALQADTVGDNARNGLVDDDPDDSGWDFTLPGAATAHTQMASPRNLYGAIGLGALAAFEARTTGNRTLVAALDVGTAMQRSPDIDSPPDFAFAVALARITENPGFAEVGRQSYVARRAAAGGAAGLGTLIRDARHASGNDGLIAFDLGWLTLSAAALEQAFPGAGFAADARTYAELVVEDLESAMPRFDIRDRNEGFYIIGLAWSQMAAQRLGERALLDQIRARLLAEQHPNGSWGTSQLEPADDLQSTAHAVLTLTLTGRGIDDAGPQAVRRAVEFLLGAQAPTGGWPDASDVELPLVNAEIMLALAAARAEAVDLIAERVQPGRRSSAAWAAQPSP